ncbi:N-acetylmuramoyl-L-alanine amidase [Xanthomonas euvesicatoria]|uniref:N-acetylmuramoyl-L-alanine amidase n=1 Tax=Xanthomonas euvesicatoria TaxID=456327 RepID=UPI0008DA0501|nr:N-acetylmuramoyl-L-alanine amidase [Xanthomonas campestris pv. viegasii]MBV6849736.1 N-acetylmuramoyl-L-alanine amidase [Xanthomonas campestris pv. heliotropii]MBV6883160.1 N-acetylmuramoyl-L-alanine amidase [Xanthomonas campestris pv. euphorbiae]OHX25912.1 N-acetylmuramoyl-L-alanine amidase [Xanthomonas alfalfae]
MLPSFSLSSSAWLRAAVCLAALSLGACAHAPQRNPLAQWVPSPNYDMRRPILIVLHFTDQQSVRQSLSTLRGRNSGGRVSAHYLIGEDGQRYQLVSDGQRAWHGGAGRWGTITDINSASIGIELDNDGSEPFAPAQIDSLLVLLDDLCQRLRIPRTQIVGHEDVAPTRKNDPGPLFPWKRLADAGFGRWPAADAPAAPEGFDPWQALALIGYSIDDPAATLQAFHHHYRGNSATTLDAEDLRILSALTHHARPSSPRPALEPTEGDDH